MTEKLTKWTTYTDDDPGFLLIAKDAEGGCQTSVHKPRTEEEATKLLQAAAVVFVHAVVAAHEKGFGCHIQCVFRNAMEDAVEQMIEFMKESGAELAPPTKH